MVLTTFSRETRLAQRLCALGFIPDIRLFQLGIDLF
jgi:Fe2+ transport system protein FeoA